MKSIIFEVLGEQFNNAPQYTLGPIEELQKQKATVFGVWVVLQDTVGGTAPILKGWQIAGDAKLIINIDESQLQPTDKVVISIIYQGLEQDTSDGTLNPTRR